MDKDSKIVIIGAGIFGLSTAYQLASEGYRNLVVLDRHMPPVGSHFFASRAQEADNRRSRMDLVLIFPVSFDSTMETTSTWGLPTKLT